MDCARCVRFYYRLKLCTGTIPRTLQELVDEEFEGMLPDVSMMMSTSAPNPSDHKEQGKEEVGVSGVSVRHQVIARTLIGRHCDSKRDHVSESRCILKAPEPHSVIHI